MLDLALEHDLIQKSGSFFSHGETRLGQGRNNTKEFLRDNPELRDELERQITAKLGAARRRGAAEAPRGPGPRAGCRGRGEGGGVLRAARGGGQEEEAEEGCLEEDPYELALRALGHKERTEAELARVAAGARGGRGRARGSHRAPARGGRDRRRALRPALRRGQARAARLGTRPHRRVRCGRAGIDEPLIEAAVEAEGAEALLERALGAGGGERHRPVRRELAGAGAVAAGPPGLPARGRLRRGSRPGAALEGRLIGRPIAPCG